MYEWQGLEHVEALNLVNTRDPRQFPAGYASVDDVAFGAGVTVWFADSREMSAFIREVEASAYGLTEEEVGQLRQLMTPQLERLAETGPSDEIRDRLNESSAGMWRIVWWGRFEDLRRGRTDGSREVLEAFREVDDDEKTGPITDEELEAFIEYARAWRT